MIVEMLRIGAFSIVLSGIDKLLFCVIGRSLWDGCRSLPSEQTACKLWEPSLRLQTRYTRM
jgi:hypothetical protein